MSRRRPRDLRSDESELWQRIARTARPLHEKARVIAPRKDPTEEKAVSPMNEPVFVPDDFRVGARSQAERPWTAALPESMQQPAEPSPKMHRNSYRRLKQGKTKPEARIDLHGMTADNAHAALSGFLFRAQTSGKRLILVITGKGRTGTDNEGPIPSRPGVLRRSLPQWLASPPLNSIVQEWTEAHATHGGSGAFYVYLRRPR